MRREMIMALSTFSTAPSATANDRRLILAALFVAYVVLWIAALRDWVRNPRSRYLSRWAWLAIIVILSLVGPAAYLIWGREGDETPAHRLRRDRGIGRAGSVDGAED